MSVLGSLLLCCLPAIVALGPRGGGTAVVHLRYIFVPGHTLSYREIAGSIQTISFGTEPAADVQTLTSTVHLLAYVNSVTPDGNATLTEDSVIKAITGTDALAAREFVGGSEQMVTLAPTGQAVGTPVPFGGFPPVILPRAPVRVGTEWSTQESVRLPLFSPQTAAIHVRNVLAGLAVAGGEPVAVISSTAMLKIASFDATLERGAPALGTLSGSFSARTDVGLGSGQVVTGRLRQVLIVTTRPRSHGGSADTSRYVEQVYIQRLAK